MNSNLLVVLNDEDGTGLIFEPQITVEITSRQIIQLIPLRYGPRNQVYVKANGQCEALILFLRSMEITLLTSTPMKA